MSAERRQRSRCEVCQGPTNADGTRCRNSLCAFNHRDVSCPRCQQTGPEATRFDDAAQFHYFCNECQNKWVAKKSG